MRLHDLLKGKNIAMNIVPMNEQECQQDTLQRVHTWLGVLERRIVELLEATEPALLKPGERESAASRHLLLVLRLLQFRQQYAEASPSAGEQALLDALLGEMDEE
ncbi:MAG TPA: hypothetical protein VGN15_10540 [Ktedonobacteraceae bacterium]|nr:hypothetical protein [Ktedonobacteraceae bacterium]